MTGESLSELTAAPALPVLVIGFNRAESLRRVVSAISKQRVAKLYIWIDGPRAGNETDIDQQREISQFLEEQYFRFPVDKFFQRQNLGCKVSVSSAIDWFFENEDRGAILEDDCIPGPDFIGFVSSQLERWESDPEVFSISGHSVLDCWPKDLGSYHFSKYPHIWGWGTWRRVWENYDSEITSWPALRRTNWLRKRVGLASDAARFWTYKFDQVSRNKVDTWDYQLTFLSFLQKGKSVIPHTNLVENVGFGPEATHTKHPPTGFARKVSVLADLRHPENATVDHTLDRYLELKALRTKRTPWELAEFLIRAFLRANHSRKESQKSLK